MFKQLSVLVPSHLGKKTTRIVVLPCSWSLILAIKGDQAVSNRAWLHNKVMSSALSIGRGVIGSINASMK